MVRAEGCGEGDGGRAEVARYYRCLICEGEVDDRRLVAIPLTVSCRGQSQVLEFEAVVIQPHAEGACPVRWGSSWHGPSRRVGVEVPEQQGGDAFVEGVVEEVLEGVSEGVAVVADGVVDVDQSHEDLTVLHDVDDDGVRGG